MVRIKEIKKYKIPENDIEFDTYKEVEDFLSLNKINKDFIFLEIIKKYQCENSEKIFNNYAEVCEYLENKMEEK